MKSLSRVRLFVAPWTVAYQAPPSMGFSRQEYWSGLPFPSPGDLPDPGTEPCGLPHGRQMLYCLTHQGREELTLGCVKVWFVEVSTLDSTQHTAGSLGNRGRPLKRDIRK